MNKFGMPTLIEMSELEESAMLCRELGLDFIEISMSLPQYTLEAIDIEHFNYIAKKYGIFYTIHLDENVNFADFNAYISKACFEYIKETIGMAKKIDAKIINMHFHRGEHFTLPDRKVDLFEVYGGFFNERVCAFRDMCEREIADSNIKICIENCKGYQNFQKNALDYLLESNAFALTLDIGHDHTAGRVDRPYILEHKSRLYHMHMHDAQAKKDHLALGTGEIDINDHIELAKDTGCSIVLETKTIEGLRQSVEWLKKHGFIQI